MGLGSLTLTPKPLLLERLVGVGVRVRVSYPSPLPPTPLLLERLGQRTQLMRPVKTLGIHDVGTGLLEGHAAR